MVQVDTTENRIQVTGHVNHSDFLRIQAAIHNSIARRGYQDIHLDMGPCSKAFAGPMLGLCSYLGKIRAAGIDIQLTLPGRDETRRLFLNTGWAHLIDPSTYPESEFRGNRHLPATVFQSGAEQQAVVNSMLNAALSSMQELRREDLDALEWSINEITDNVMVHSDCEQGGIVQLNQFPRDRRIEYVVSDAGVGIPKTLRAGHPKITSDPEALDRAIREGVTGGKGMGNGLFGSYRVSEESGGYFKLYSGNGLLDYDASRGLSVRRNEIPLNGTLVVAGINLDERDLLARALRFKGKVSTMVDHIELNYEDESGNIRFRMVDECRTFGNRAAGSPVRTKLENLLRASPSARILVSMEGVPLLSSSFADEVFGKLVRELGPVLFMSRFQFVHLTDAARRLIDRAIAQRLVDVDDHDGAGGGDPPGL